MLNRINQILRYLFFAIFVNFFILIVMGINVRHRERLPKKGSAIIVANHNSHLDAMVLIHLFSCKLLPKIHPIAAADYFLRNKLFAWFSTKIVGIIPIDRQKTEKNKDPLMPCYQYLEEESILIFFPEGTRGEPEQRSSFKKGIAHLVERFPDVPVIPIFMHGLGKALPKGEALLVPFFCDVFIGNALYGSHYPDKELFMNALNEMFEKLVLEGNFRTWE